jgi:hypothetical protein
MGARKKLNAVFLHGSLVVAAIGGLIAQSWAVFILALAVLLGASLYAGDIRPSRRDRSLPRGQHHSDKRRP